MSMPGYQDIYIKLPLDQSQGLLIPPGDHLVTVDEADSELAHGYYFLLRVGWILVKVDTEII